MDDERSEVEISQDGEENMEKIKVEFETSALNGLRGFAAFHILIFHSLFYSTLGFIIYGQVGFASLLHKF